MICLLIGSWEIDIIRCFIILLKASRNRELLFIIITIIIINKLIGKTAKSASVKQLIVQEGKFSFVLLTRFDR